MLESPERSSRFRTVIGVVGCRTRSSSLDKEELIEKVLQVYSLGDIFCSGGCSTGADFFIKQFCKAKCLPYLEFPANWTDHGKSAGILRNMDIANVCDILIAMVDERSIYKSGEHSGGTESTIRYFIKYYGKDGLHIL